MSTTGARTQRPTETPTTPPPPPPAANGARHLLNRANSTRTWDKTPARPPADGLAFTIPGDLKMDQMSS